MPLPDKYVLQLQEADMRKNTKQSHDGIHTPLMTRYLAVHDYTGGLPVVEVMMSKSYDGLRKKLDSNNTSHVLTLEEAMHILRITGDTRILDAINAEAGTAWFFPEYVPTAPWRHGCFEVQYPVDGPHHGPDQRVPGVLEDGDVNAEERARLDQCRMELFEQIKHYDHTAKKLDREGMS